MFKPSVAPVRYAITGLGTRAHKLYLPYLTDPEVIGRGRLVAMADVDPHRLAEASGRWPLPGFCTGDVRPMLEQMHPDVLIVTTPDYVHGAQIEAALDAGTAVLTEKPMTVDARQASAVVSAQRRSGAVVQVAHNLRYLNLHEEIKRLLGSGVLGEITGIFLSYRLAAEHGRSYFTRWHRQKWASGGLQVTKSCHHLDLCNWWLGEYPTEVVGWTRRKHYRGRSSPWPVTDEVPEDADIDDTIDAVIRYPTGVLVHYSLSARCAWEGYTLTIQGTKGELSARYEIRDADGAPVQTDYELEVNLRGRPRRTIVVPREPGTHSGADARMLAKVLEPKTDANAAGAIDGAYAVATGEALTRSAATGVPSRIDEMLELDG